MHTRPEPHEPANGFAAIILLVMLLPVLLVVGSFIQTMTGRNDRLQLEIREEQALLDAESGVDVALFHAREGSMTDGAVYTETMPSGGAFTARCDYIASADVFRVISTGTLGVHRRRVAAYLGFSSFLGNLSAAVTMMNQTPNLRLTGSALTDGTNVLISGAAVGSGDTYGMAITPPATTAEMLASLTVAEQAQIVGLGGAPSLGTAAAPDLGLILGEARNAANFVITNGIVPNGNYGSPSGSSYIVYREGNLKITGNSTGSGLLVVNGDLTVVGTMTWYGVVVVTGQLNCGAGTANIVGGILLGPACSDIDLRGTADLQYSQEAIDLARNLTGRYVAFNGWQEITTNN